MSVLLRRSLLVLSLLFGLLFAVGFAVLWHYHIGVWYAVAFSVSMVFLQFLLGPVLIELVFKIGWTHPQTISPELAQFIQETCRVEGIPVPRFGVIEDGNPSAFTYGHVPSDARLVVTRGLINMLDGEELKGVVGHEIGHIKHWDFLMMTVASAISLALYTLYFWTRRHRRGETFVVAIAAYVAYVASQYLVLFLSRIREYYADYHSSVVTGNPNALATALVKIAYGLSRGQEPQPEDADDKKKKKGEQFNAASALAAMSFCSPNGASAFAIASSDLSGNFSMDNMRRAMRWDLFNPWARWFELNSTHPLPAKRIRDLMSRSRDSRLAAAYSVSAPAQSYTGKFVVDILVAILPYIGALCGLAVAGIGGFRINVEGMPHGLVAGIGYVLSLTGAGMLMRTLLSYRSGFEASTIASLICQTDVSHIRPIPTEIRGKVIGRGIPGLFWSSDLVIQDETGFTTLQYRQPLHFLEPLFGWLRAGSLIGQEAVVRGWYRRGPGPYIEMREAVLQNGDTVKCYYYQFMLGVSAAMAVAGMAIAFVIG